MAWSSAKANAPRAPWSMAGSRNGLGCLGFRLLAVCGATARVACRHHSSADVPVAADLVPDLAAFGVGGRDRDAVGAVASDAELDAVLGEQRGQLCSEEGAVLAVHQGSSSARASASEARTSSMWRASTP